MAATLAALSLTLSVATPLLDTQSSFRATVESAHDPSVCPHHDHSICTQARANHFAPAEYQSSALHALEAVEHRPASVRDERSQPTHLSPVGSRAPPASNDSR
jgi:hypothetical protein